MRLVLSVGESSGDYLAARLVADLKTRLPHVDIKGMAGPLMIEQGVEPWFDMSALNVMGLQEVVRHLPRLLRLRKDFQKKIMAWQPDAFIGIDAPDFNLNLAKRLKRQGVRTLHYVSPSIWAWRSGRARTIAQSVDHMLTLFPFEPKLYQPFGLDAVCVGHPLADDITALLKGNPKRPTQHGDQPTIALLPGSRVSEVKRHAQLLAETAKLIKGYKPEAKLCMPLIDHEHQHLITHLSGHLMSELGVEFVINNTRKTLHQADVAINASGTVTLETFLLGCPQVVYYQLAPLTYALAKVGRLLHTDHISLPNILAKEALVPELVQQQATPQTLVHEALSWLEDTQRLHHYQATAAFWRHELSADARAASAIIRRLGC